MDRFARLAASVLATPGAVVVAPGGDAPGQDAEVVQCWPPEHPPAAPWHAALRRHVADTGELLMVDDLSRWTGDGGEAAGEGAAGALAAAPLRGAQGEHLGVMAVHDPRPRTWSERNRQDLEDLAGACATELRLRAGTRRANDAHRGAQEARDRAQAATGAAVAGAQQLQNQLNRSELLLRAAELLGSTWGLDHVRATVSELVSGDLKPAYVGLVLLGEDDMLRRSVDAGRGPVPLEEQVPLYALTDRWPTAQAARENRVVSVPDRRTLVEGYDPQTVAVFDQMGLHSAVCVPLPGTHRPTLGTLVAAWDEPHETDLHERAVLTVIAGYTARAVERALHLDERVSVARQLQRAMLTDLPQAPGLELAALYRPAAHHDMVGGDWYDAYRIPHQRPADDEREPLALTVGDITGHNTQAAALMGQARSMLRQADVDRRRGPADTLTSFERANEQLRIGISGTLVHAHLHPRPDGAWLLRWTNAGHPHPLLAHPRRPVERLTEHGMMLHPALPPLEGRPVDERLLEPGSVLLLYTDGLIERRGRDLEQGIDHVAALLAPAVADHTPLPRTLDLLAENLAGSDHRDDVVLLALRVTDPSAG
ncbi:GAF domain-containing protein [Kitasatospora sp. SolWspMP-SS2h]|uniref:PP2C family protein-serine/threonine phosphatase n=1 Tax=Kitasatospora sp. SolWspMP-SS2h TaxID=1305729 RepID=UPI000DBF8E62|nr:GAF domain-containing SpoIIE family protein phosphatase [Kitasatospora sp. SolWspMP-SS2h]RAJ39970.1 GAF domain-containing protein [Kitasatospora sp. SolWspMP-SS2h]